MVTVMSPDTNDVHVWYRLTETLTVDAIRAAAAGLSADEAERHARFRFAHDQRDYAVAHDLVRRSLSVLADVTPEAWRFAPGERGKPQIEPSMTRVFPDGPRELSFNLSHTRGLVSCAAAWGGPVGIDVERLDRDVGIEGLAGRYFSRAEVSALEQSNDRRARFFELWTLKEAFLKSTGAGLHQPLTSMSFDLIEDGTIRFEPPAGTDCSEWQFALCAPADDMRLAIAARSRPGVAVRFALHSDELRDAPALQLLGMTRGCAAETFAKDRR
jgi:4'-phosphopantetheinyl transferase